jgi:hypothetical protein
MFPADGKRTRMENNAKKDKVKQEKETKKDECRVHATIKRNWTLRYAHVYVYMCAQFLRHYKQPTLDLRSCRPPGSC